MMIFSSFFKKSSNAIDLTRYILRIRDGTILQSFSFLFLVRAERNVIMEENLIDLHLIFTYLFSEEGLRIITRVANDLLLSLAGTLPQKLVCRLRNIQQRNHILLRIVRNIGAIFSALPDILKNLTASRTRFLLDIDQILIKFKNVNK